MTAEAAAQINHFRALDDAQLGAIFSKPAAMPALEPGHYTGTWLRRIENAGTYKPFNLVSQWLMFELTPFGITFQGNGSGIWYFFHPSLAAGEFEATAERSRWRDTDCLALHYDRARLPQVVRQLLYDEVKPLSPRHALAIGGFNQPAGEGDNFWFLLTKN